MSSAICQNFIQNAWKKELCSNCFKSKDEHAVPSKPKAVPLIVKTSISGIIRDPKKSKPKLNVAFTKELAQFIGYGGEDWLSEDEAAEEPAYECEEVNCDDLLTDSDEEEHTKEIRMQTKKNTNFNTVSLGEMIEEKKSYAHLMLGKPVVNSDGKKQTLLVSVTPFGEDSTPRKYNATKSYSSRELKSPDKEASKSSNVVLTSYNNKPEVDSSKAGNEEKSLLDEISETLEKSNNSILGRRKTPARETENGTNGNNKENIGTVQITEGPISCEVAQKVDRKINLTRTPALKSRDLDKPVYQTSTARIELLNSKNLKKPHKDLPDKTIPTQQKENSDTNNNDNSADNRLSQGDQKLFRDIISSSNFIKSEIQISTSQLNTVKIDESVAVKTNSEFNLPLSESREQAGKPDGREDPEAPELPALPLTPPPSLENQHSFLHPHGDVCSTAPAHAPPLLYEKPKIPSKPATVLIRKPVNIQNISHMGQQNQPMTTFTKEPLIKQQDSAADMDPKCNKRRAPQPPEETMPLPINNLPNTPNPPQLFTRNSAALPNGDSPVVREKEKRERTERASSCTPKMYISNGNSEKVESHYQTPAPIPRKSLSISTDNLVVSADEKRKPKGRFSLRKFLRMGSSKDLPRLSGDSSTIEEANDTPKPRPRLVIVHPSELNGSKVEVVAKPDQMDSPPVQNSSNERPPLKVNKPPPPPRNYDNWKPPMSGPPPPKSMEILNKQRALSRSSSNSSTGVTKPKAETVYANIGEVRSSIVPNKPVRTASMREREAQQQKQLQQRKDNYDSVGNGRLKQSENVYDYVNSSSNRSSSPSSDSSGKNSPKSKTARLNKRSESSIDVSGEYFKYGNIPRSMSLTYCGSETESEIYAPYSFYGSETEVTEDDHDWIQNGRTHKLRSKKGRSIVHKNLEDNYGAVVVANHEALAQVLENIQQTVYIQPALRGLKMCSNLRLMDFSMKTGTAPVSIGSRTFRQALWGAQHVTLAFNTGISTSSTLNLGTFHLNSVTDFSDLIPSEYCANEKQTKKQVQATISVLPWLQVHTIESYGALLKTKPNQDETWRDGFFVMLQLVNALKMLQAQGIEELPLSLNSFILSKEVDRETHHRLCIMQGTLPSELTTLTSPEEKYGSLCTCASKAMSLLQPNSKTTTLIQSLLNNERSVSLTQVKAVLEFSLWGPSDVSLGSTVRERELTLQRWLDLQRATVLHGLVCTRVQLTVYEECHLLFLVRSNARMMSDASMLIESNNLKHAHTSKA
ncbi:hypothetical protein HUJ04_006568 [Dendroctonus ponderosae]|uniref:Uncharacterized protein n=1 Tax=Dendroctonus ponderosae TaxID=77166 RepID=A0AAR5PQE4_DENPD|nr:hypothetical protein HUJ04_006568 [Dendroctonus ponderosae]